MLHLLLFILSHYRLLLSLHINKLGLVLFGVCHRFSIRVLGVFGHVDDVRGLMLDLSRWQNIYIDDLRWLLVPRIVVCWCRWCWWLSLCWWVILWLKAFAAAFVDGFLVQYATHDDESNDDDSPEYCSANQPS